MRVHPKDWDDPSVRKIPLAKIEQEKIELAARKAMRSAKKRPDVKGRVKIVIDFIGI